MKKFAVTALPKLALPAEILPDTAKLVNVPTLVIFGCALSTTVFAMLAAPTIPVTLPACMLLKLLPLPIK